MMDVKPSKEHEWLQQFVGEWTMEGECVMGPDQPPMKNTGTESVRSLGGLWTLGEGQGTSPDGSAVTSVLTLGYDPQKNKFVGSFIASMMTHQWLYEGSLDASGKVLTMDCEGPDFTGGGMAKYQDIFEVVDKDHRTLSSQTKGPDGKWVRFMTARYTRTK
jgi:hypothetical protein